VKKNLLKKTPSTYLDLHNCCHHIPILGYQELYSLKSEYTKEGLFKLCSEGKVDMYGCVTGGVW